MPESLKCPVCRAVQPMQPVCRRCSADLELLNRSLKAMDSVRTQLKIAQLNGANPDTIARLRKRLHWLSPKSV
jgi:hypothetical protein